MPVVELVSLNGMAWKVDVSLEQTAADLIQSAVIDSALANLLSYHANSAIRLDSMENFLG